MGWPAGRWYTDGLATDGGLTLGVVEVSVVDTHYGVSQPEQTLSGRGARVYKIIQKNTNKNLYSAKFVDKTRQRLSASMQTVSYSF